MNSEDEKPKYFRQKLIGYEVEFPFSPYGIQRAMMTKLSGALTNKEHFLLESPTGTGKTLVLLCSALAWQKVSKSICQPLMSKKLREEKSKERLDKLMNRPCSCGRRANNSSEYDDLKDAKKSSKKENGSGDKQYDFENDDIALCKKAQTENCSDLKSSPYFDKGRQTKKQKISEPEYIIIDDDDDDDQEKKKASENDVKPTVNVKAEQQLLDDDCEILDDTESMKERKPQACTKEDPEEASDKSAKSLCRSCEAIKSELEFKDVIGDSAHDGRGLISSKIKAKIPRIYYGTRTHKQITQVIRELNKTSYKSDLKMCILSARERACINSEVKDLPDRNDRCQELIKNKPDTASMSRSRAKNKDYCPYYIDSNHIAAQFEFINEEFKTEAWDIEDAAKFGIQHQVCPYYGIRSLQDQADITFCPYNYLLDPNIRKAMNINLSNAVVIFDEAHNIEDICRDSASLIIDTVQIKELQETIAIVIRNYVQGSDIFDAYRFFLDQLAKLDSALRRFEFTELDNQKYSDFLKKKVMSQIDMENFMKMVSLGPEDLQKIKDNAKALRGEDESTEKSSKSSSDNQDPALSFAQMQFIDQLCITLEFMYADNKKYLQDFRLVITESLERNPRRQHIGISKDRNAPMEERDKHLRKLHLLCMNPGIPFEKIHSQAWSVIVASGTLSPTESLKTELGCKFPQVFEGAHVINRDRIFASILSRGPGGLVDLKCSYQESLKLEFQDEIGSIIRDVCKRVPNGVLVFFPSYDRLESFYQRWNLTKVMAQIQGNKKVFREQRNQPVAKFEEDLCKYNDHAKRKGALLFAVFRGKVSEGIDFADKAARAVITIGIPYPHLGELTIGLKRDYNDTMRRKRPYLMTGGDWYSAQAFRALNQALGRCIRHQNDWGAIIMIDSRLNSNSNLNSISKWLRKVLSQDSDYMVIRDKLEDFVDAKSKEEDESPKVEVLRLD